MKLKKVWKLLALVSLIFLLISCGKKKEEKACCKGKGNQTKENALPQKYGMLLPQA